MTIPFLKKARRKRENARFRQRDADTRLAVRAPLSRREMRQRRRARTLALLRWGAAGLGLLLLAAYARSQWIQAFHSNPEFAVGRFEYHSNGGIPARQAAAAAGLRSDMNLMEVDPGEVRSRLLALPRVKDVRVERRLPDRLVIEVNERLPVAWMTSVEHGRGNNIDQRSRLFVDRDGVVFKCEELLREYMMLPVINAADQPVITLGREIGSAAVRGALTLLEEMRVRDWPVPCSVSRIDIPNSWTLAAEMESGALYTFHPEHLARQLDRLAFILGKARAARRSVASVNLQMQRNVPVRFFEGLAEAETAPRREPGTAVPFVEPRNVFFTAPEGPAPSAAGRRPAGRPGDSRGAASSPQQPVAP
jgi:cell division septal protein FtsQ